MAFQIRFFMLLSMSICLASVVLAKQGTSIVYSQPYVPSTCFGYQDQGFMIAGANPTLYDGGRVCGRRYKVKCLGGTDNTPNPCKFGEIIVRIVQFCGECGANEISLSRYAFSRIANLYAKRIRVDYTQV